MRYCRRIYTATTNREGSETVWNVQLIQEVNLRVELIGECTVCYIPSHVTCQSALMEIQHTGSTTRA